jgi:ParB family chromosome partitioning protein
MALDLSFTTLADIAQSGGGGRPIEIPLSDIIEDPDQPRRIFDESELKDLAASIKARGVLQAISVRPKNAEGKHVIIFGARRYRASKLAGQTSIRAVVEEHDASEPYLQLIENIQRDDLKPVEIAAFVAGRLKAGDRASDIAERLGKPKDWVSRFAAVTKMPDFLRTKLETSPIRAIYELYQGWREHPDAVERLAREHDVFTDAQARRLVQGLRARNVASRPKPSVDSRLSVEESAAFEPSATHERPGSWAPVEGEVSDRSDRPQADRSNPSGNDQQLAAAVRRLEGQLRAESDPVIIDLMRRYEALAAAFAQDLALPRDVLISRRGALLLIQAVAAHR